MCFAQCRDKSHDDEARQAGEYFSDLQKKLQNFFLFCQSFTFEWWANWQSRVMEIGVQ